MGLMKEMFREMPPPPKRKRRPAKDREGPVVKACLKWLADHKVFAWRNNTGAVEFSDGGFMRFGAKGSPDIIGMTRSGRFLGIECKSPTGEQSGYQKQWQARCQDQGGLYILARCVDDLDLYVALICS